MSIIISHPDYVLYWFGDCTSIRTATSKISSMNICHVRICASIRIDDCERYLIFITILFFEIAVFNWVYWFQEDWGSKVMEFVGQSTCGFSWCSFSTRLHWSEMSSEGIVRQKKYKYLWFVVLSFFWKELTLSLKTVLLACSSFIHRAVVRE